MPIDLEPAFMLRRQGASPFRRYPRAPGKNAHEHYKAHNVHLYRGAEMCLRYDGIGAPLPAEEVAANVADIPTDQAVAIDCDGKNLGAHVDIVGDAEYIHRRPIKRDVLVNARQ